MAITQNTAIAPFPITPELAAIAIAYKNNKFIADDVLTRVQVPQITFRYKQFPQADGFTVPETKIGRTSRPNRIETGYTETQATCVDYGLEDVVPVNDILVAQAAGAGYDPVSYAAEWLAYLVALDREKRVASLVFDSTQYGTNNKSTLSGTSQWSDFTNSNPVTAIMTALDACVMRPNMAVFGRATYSQLIQHPKVVQAVFKTQQGAGIVPRQAIADLFELNDVFVGEAFSNTAVRGQTVSLARLWGKHASFLYRDVTAARAGQTTFGFTAQFGPKFGGSKPHDDAGLRGGVAVRIGETVKEVICANDLGYMYVNAVA
jgi:hypothetical protein